MMALHMCAVFYSCTMGHSTTTFFPGSQIFLTTSQYENTEGQLFNLVIGTDAMLNVDIKYKLTFLSYQQYSSKRSNDSTLPDLSNNDVPTNPAECKY